MISILNNFMVWQQNNCYFDYKERVWKSPDKNNNGHYRNITIIEIIMQYLKDKIKGDL